MQSANLGWIHKTDADLIVGILTVLDHELRVSALKYTLHKYKQALLGSPQMTF